MRFVSALLGTLLLLTVLSGNAHGRPPVPRGPYVPPPSHVWPRVVVICIDNASMARLGGYPFDRGLHARLVERLVEAGASGIAFDLYFGEPRTTAGDQAFARVVARSRRTWLIVDPTTTGDAVPHPPLTLFARAAGWRVGGPAIEHGQHFIGGVRIAPIGRTKVPHVLVGLMADFLRLRTWPVPLPGGDRTRVGEWVLPTPGGVFTSDNRDTRRLALNADSRIRLYSYARVLGGEIPAQAFAGAVVLVGVTPSPRTGEELIFEDWSLPGWVMRSHVESLAILFEKMMRALDRPLGKG